MNYRNQYSERVYKGSQAVVRQQAQEEVEGFDVSKYSTPDYVWERNAQGALIRIYKKPQAYASSVQGVQGGQDVTLAEDTFIPEEIMFEGGKESQHIQRGVYLVEDVNATLKRKYAPYESMVEKYDPEGMLSSTQKAWVSTSGKNVNRGKVEYETQTFENGYETSHSDPNKYDYAPDQVIKEHIKPASPNNPESQAEFWNLMANKIFARDVAANEQAIAENLLRRTVENRGEKFVSGSFTGTAFKNVVMPIGENAGTKKETVNGVTTTYFFKQDPKTMDLNTPPYLNISITEPSQQQLVIQKPTTAVEDAKQLYSQGVTPLYGGWLEYKSVNAPPTFEQPQTNEGLGRLQSLYELQGIPAEKLGVSPFLRKAVSGSESLRNKAVSNIDFIQQDQTLPLVQKATLLAPQYAAYGTGIVAKSANEFSLFMAEQPVTTYLMGKTIDIIGSKVTPILQKGISKVLPKVSEVVATKAAKVIVYGGILGAIETPRVLAQPTTKGKIETLIGDVATIPLFISLAKQTGKVKDVLFQKPTTFEYSETTFVQPIEESLAIQTIPNKKYIKEMRTYKYVSPKKDISVGEYIAKRGITISYNSKELPENTLGSWKQQNGGASKIKIAGWGKHLKASLYTRKAETPTLTLKHEVYHDIYSNRFPSSNIYANEGFIESITTQGNKGEVTIPEKGYSISFREDVPVTTFVYPRKQIVTGSVGKNLPTEIRWEGRILKGKKVIATMQGTRIGSKEVGAITKKGEITFFESLPSNKIRTKVYKTNAKGTSLIKTEVVENIRDVLPKIKDVVKIKYVTSTGVDLGVKVEGGDVVWNDRTIKQQVIWKIFGRESKVLKGKKTTVSIKGEARTLATQRDISGNKIERSREGIFGKVIEKETPSTIEYVKQVGERPSDTRAYRTDQLADSSIVASMKQVSNPSLKTTRKLKFGSEVAYSIKEERAGLFDFIKGKTTKYRLPESKIVIEETKPTKDTIPDVNKVSPLNKGELSPQVSVTKQMAQSVLVQSQQPITKGNIMKPSVKKVIGSKTAFRLIAQPKSNINAMIPISKNILLQQNQPVLTQVAPLTSIQNNLSKTQNINKTITPTVNKTLNITLNKAINKNINKAVNKTINKTVNKIVNKTLNKTINKKINKTVNVTKTLNKTVNKGITRTVNITTPQIKIPIIPKIPLPTIIETPSAPAAISLYPRSTTGYDVLIKAKQQKLAKGKYKSRGYTKANTEPLTRAEAINKGMEIVDNYTNKSFTIRKAKRAAKASLVQLNEARLNKFRASKKNPAIFVEKDMFAIDSAAEKQGIPYEAMRLRKAGLLETKKKQLNMLKLAKTRQSLALKGRVKMKNRAFKMLVSKKKSRKTNWI